MPDPLPPGALLADYPEPMRAIAEALRLVVRRAVPATIERVRPGWRLIGYDVPAGRRSHYFAWVAPEPEHVHLGFPNGVFMDDPGQVMLGVGVTKQARWLTFREIQEIDTTICAELVREAARVALLSRSERLGHALWAADGPGTGGRRERR